MSLIRVGAKLGRAGFEEQGFSTLAPEIHFPSEFSANPNQTHPNQLIDVFRITKNYRQLNLIKVGAKLKESRPQWPEFLWMDMCWLREDCIKSANSKCISSYRLNHCSLKTATTEAI